MSESGPSQDFTLRRTDWITGCIRSLAAGALHYHRLMVEGAEYLPPQGPVLLLPKHRAYRDILVEAVVLYRFTRRHANYVMKVGLYGILEWIGGVKIVRPKDIRRVKDREARRAQIRWAREENQQTLNYLAWLYRQGECIVSHPEGMRYQDTMGPLQREIVDHLLWVEREFDLRIPLIPVGLEYESLGEPRSQIYFRVGEPIYSDRFGDQDDLIDEVGRRIRLLSGLQQDDPIRPLV